MSFYLWATILCILLQALFAFFEMACISFNKVRLQYYVSIHSKRAIWLNYLLQRPSRLFGTTLVGITTSLVVGAECSRHLYESLGLNPDFAPLTQAPLVIIFGELAPLFAARRHPEQAAMALVPFMIILAKILTPITWAFDILATLIHRLMGKKEETSLFLSREEVRMAFEKQEGAATEFDTAATQIFQLKNLTAEALMIPLASAQLASSSATLSETRHLLSVHYVPILPLYHKSPTNIVGVVTLRDLLKLEDGQRIETVAHSPWFVSANTPIVQLLTQFRRNNQSLAIVLDSIGQASGILTLDQILSEIFGEEAPPLEETSSYIERTLSGEMLVADFNLQFSTRLPEDRGDTMSDLLLDQLGHLPVKEEKIHMNDLEFIIEEPTLLGIKTVRVRSIRE